MITLLIWLLILVLVIGVVFYILSLIPIPAPWGNVVRIIFALIFLLVILEWLVPLAGHPFPLR